MNLIRFVPKSKITIVPKDDSFVSLNSNSELPSDVLMELRRRRNSLLCSTEETLQFPRAIGLSVSDPLSTSILHLLENGEGSDSTDEAAD